MSTSPAPARTAGPMAPAYRLVTIALVLLTTMIAFENMAVTTAMPPAAQELGAAGSYGLAFSSMMTAMLLGIVLAGSWTDVSGPLPGLYAGAALLIAGSVWCAVAPTFPALLGGRVVTGLGAGLITVAEFVAIGRIYPAALRPRVFTWLSAAWVLPSVVGAPVAGWLAATWSWRAVFWVVVGPALLASALVVLRRSAFGTPEEAPAGDIGRAERRREARLGAIVALSCGVVQLGIHEQQPLPAPVTLAAAAGLVALGLSVPRLLPPGTVVSRRGLPSVVLSRGLLNGAFNGSITFVPLMLVRERGMDLPTAGVILAIASLGWSAGAWVQGRVRGHRPVVRSRLVVLGAALLATGCGVLSVSTAAALPTWVLALATVPIGLGMGIGSTTLSVLVLDLSPQEEHGRASASLQLADVLGSVVGIAAATAVHGGLHAQAERFSYVVLWGALAGVAATAMLTGRRCAPRVSPARHP